MDLGLESHCPESIRTGMSLRRTRAAQRLQGECHIKVMGLFGPDNVTPRVVSAFQAALDKAGAELVSQAKRLDVKGALAPVWSKLVAPIQVGSGYLSLHPVGLSVSNIAFGGPMTDRSIPTEFAATLEFKPTLTRCHATAVHP